MLELYKPDMYKKDIYSIDYKKLRSYGIKCLLFDLDNTLVPNNIKKLLKKTIYQYSCIWDIAKHCT